MKIKIWLKSYIEKWEDHYKKCAEKVCRIHNLLIEDFVDFEDNRPWSEALQRIRHEGYGLGKGGWE